MKNIDNVVIEDFVQHKTIIVPYEEYKNYKPLFNGIIGKRMINKLIANNVKFTLIEG